MVDARWKVVDGRKWASMSFSGSKVVVAGPPFDLEAELSVKGLLVADAAQNERGMEFLLVEDDKPLTLAETSRRLIAAIRKDIRIMTCPTCNGSGKLHSDNGPAPQIWDCWDCGGDDGWDDEEEDDDA